jgi:hypothetical protein
MSRCTASQPEPVHGLLRPIEPIIEGGHRLNDDMLRLEAPYDVPLFERQHVLGEYTLSTTVF